MALPALPALPLLLQKPLISSETKVADFFTWSAVLALPILVILVGLRRVFFHPLSHIPGPRLAKLTGLWRTKKYVGGNWHEEVLDLHRTYGRVVRVAPSEVSVVDESAMKRLFGHGQNAVKTNWYRVWQPPNTAPALFPELDKSTHAYLRKRTAGAYSMSSVLKYEVFIQACLDLLVEKLRSHVQNGEAINMSDWTNAFAFDVIGELGYGAQLGHLKTETDVDDLRETMLAGFTMLSTMGHLPGQSRLIMNPVVEGIMAVFGVKPPMKKFEGQVIDRIRYRQSHLDEVKRDDLLAHFCRMKDASGNPASFSEILVEALSLVGAGADTVSIGMRACLFYLAGSPEAYKRLQREVDEFYGNNQLNRPITYLETQKLPYLQAVIKEATRILPSIVYQLLRHAPADFEVRGVSIPFNTPVGMSPIAQNRDEDIWGPDANEFRPERWLEDEKKTKYLDSSTFTFGGSGPRMCIGRNIALVELHMFLAQIIRQFDFEIVNKENPWRITSYWFAYQHDLLMRLTPRNLA